MRELFEGILENIRGIDYTNERVANSAEVHQLEEAICRVEDAVIQWAANQAAFVEEATDAATRISHLEHAVERRALLLHYLDGRTWEYICELMDYSWQRMMEIRKAAVLHMYDLMPTEWRDPRHPAL